MWIAGLAVIAAIAASYHLTRPPELVWWTSPPIDERGHRVNALVPRGWGPGHEPLEGLNLGGASPEFLLVAPVTHLASWMPSWLKDLIMALTLGLVVAYMVLATQFDSFIDPVTVLMARVGIHHRLIMKSEGGVLDVLDLITREQLMTTLKRLRAIFEEQPGRELARAGVAGYEPLKAARYGSLS